MRKILSKHDYQNLKEMFWDDGSPVDEYLTYDFFDSSGNKFSAVIVFGDVINYDPDADYRDENNEILNNPYSDMQDTEIIFYDIIPYILKGKTYCWNAEDAIFDKNKLNQVLRFLMEKANAKQIRVYVATRSDIA